LICLLPIRRPLSKRRSAMPRGAEFDLSAAFGEVGPAL
jgi:hypothetical protein